jgi:hypothetical protein
VAGPRAVPRLLALVDVQDDPRLASLALAALEGADDERIVEPALTAAESPDAGVAAAALGVLRGWVTREAGTRVLDAVTAIAVDPARDSRIRRAAFEALSDLPPDLLRQIPRDLPAGDPAVPVEHPIAVRAWLESDGKAAPLSALHDLVRQLRECEQAGPAHLQGQWRAARGAAHATLAARGSRVALYDLRETFDAVQGPLPIDFLAAAIAVGDASCLEPMGRAWEAAAADPWWRERLAEAGAAIMRRARLSGRSAVVKRIRTKWPGFL